MKFRVKVKLMKMRPIYCLLIASAYAWFNDDEMPGRQEFCAVERSNAHENYFLLNDYLYKPILDAYDWPPPNVSQILA